MDGSADAEFHFAEGEVIEDVLGIRQAPCEPAQFGDAEGVTGTDGSKRLA